jgi:hypothetical protein
VRRYLPASSLRGPPSFAANRSEVKRGLRVEGREIDAMWQESPSCGWCSTMSESIQQSLAGLLSRFDNLISRDSKRTLHWL